MRSARTFDGKKIETRTRGGKSATRETVRPRDPHNYESTSVRDVFDASGVARRGESANVTEGLPGSLSPGRELAFVYLR